jgi:Carbohydrate esterase, sialic acid-specific acetylesterase
MRQRFPLVVLVVALAASAAIPAALSSATQAPPTQVFVLAGQSNMLGRGKPLSLGAPSDPRLLVWRNASSSWEIALDPLGDPRENDNGIGPGMTFGLTAIQHLPADTVGLVMCAVGATSMKDWQPAGKPYKNCVKATRAAGGHVGGILFLQGERDSRSKSDAGSWSKRFRKLLAAFRADLGPDVPVVIGQIGKLSGSKHRYQDRVRQQQAIAAASNPGVALVSTLDLPVSEDGGHFTVASYQTIGVRFADAWWQLEQALASPVSTG